MATRTQDTGAKKGFFQGLADRLKPVTDAITSPGYWLGAMVKAWTPEKYQGNYPRLHHLAAPFRFIWSAVKTVGAAVMLPVAIAGTLVKTGWKYGVQGGITTLREAASEWKKGNKGKAILKGLWGGCKMLLGAGVIAGTLTGLGFLVATGVGAIPAAVAGIGSAIGHSALATGFASLASGVGSALGVIGTLGGLVVLHGGGVVASATVANVVAGLLIGLPSLGIMYWASKKIEKTFGVTINKARNPSIVKKSEPQTDASHAKLETNSELARELSATDQEAYAMRSTGPSSGQTSHSPIIMHGQPAQAQDKVYMPPVDAAQILQAEQLVQGIKQDKKYEHGCSLDQNTGVITCQGPHMMDIAATVMQDNLYQGKQFTLTVDKSASAEAEATRLLSDAAKRGLIDKISIVKIGDEVIDPQRLSQMKSQARTNAGIQPPSVPPASPDHHQSFS